MTIRSLNDLNKDELKAAGDQFGSELQSKMSKAQMIRILTEDGVTPELYNSLLSSADDEEVDLADIDSTPLDEPQESPTASADPESLVLIRMTRRNHSYEVRGYKFTRQHPFVPVTEEDAEWLVEKGGGFRPATNREIKEFYN